MRARAGGSSVIGTGDLGVTLAPGEWGALFVSNKKSTSTDLQKPRAGMRVSAILGVIEQFTVGSAAFAVYALVLRRLGAEDLGVWSLTTTAAAIAGLLSFPNSTTLYHHLAQAESIGERQKSVAIVETAFLMVAIAYAALCIIAYFPFFWFINSSVPAEKLNVAGQLVPIIFVSIFLTNVSNVLSCALGALHKMYIRSILNICATILMFFVTFLLFDTFGVVASAIGMIAQQFLLFILGSIAVKRSLPELRLLRPRINWTSARAIITLSLPMQSITLSLILWEPFTRIILGLYGALDGISLFTVAWRLVLLPRGFINSAVLPIAPAFAADDDKAGRDRLQRRALDFVVGLMPIITAATIGVAPVVGELMFGRYRPDFVVVTTIVALGILWEAVSVVPYLRSIGEGRLKWSVAGHLVTSALNVVLGTVGAHFWGTLGAIAGLSVAVAVGTIVITAGNVRMFGNRIRDICLTKHWLAFASSMAAAPTCLVIYWLLRPSCGLLQTAAVMAAGGAVIVAAPVLRLARSLSLIRARTHENGI